VLLALALVYSLLFSAAHLGVSFFVFSNRSMVQSSMSSVLISPSLDGAIWGIAVLLVSVWLFSTLFLGNSASKRSALLVLVPFMLLSLAFFGLFGFSPLVLASFADVVLYLGFTQSLFGGSMFSALKRLISGVVLVFVFVEGAALVLFNGPFVLNLSVADWVVAGHWRLVELSLSNLAYPFLPYSYLLFIILGVVAFLVNVAPAWRLPEKWSNVQFVRLWGRFRDIIESCKEQAYAPFRGRFPIVAVVLFSFVISSLLVVVTVLPWMNPTNRLVSVDAPVYYQWLIHMRGVDLNSALSFAFANDRAAFMVLSYLLSFVVSPVSLMQLIAVLLIPLFCVASLLVVRLVCGFRDAWVYTVLIVPFSVQALGLIYSGYFANMLAMIFVYLYFVLLLWVFRSGSSLGVFGLLGVSLLVLFSHSWTWYVLVLSLGAFLILEWRMVVRKGATWGRFKWKVSVVGASVVVGLVSDLVRNLLTATSASVSVLDTARMSLGFPSGEYVLSGLRLTTNFYLGGVFSEALLVFLFILGFLFMLSFKSEMSRLLVSWVFVASVLMLFASAETVFNRFLFLMPSAIFSGLGLSFLIRFGFLGFQGSRAKKLGFELLIVVLVFVFLLNFGLHYVSNMSFD
jgi:hypothetical protein